MKEKWERPRFFIGVRERELNLDKKIEKDSIEKNNI